MSFIDIKTTGYGRIPGEGPKDARIAIVGEAGGAEEDRHKRPFVGPAGRVLEQCMHAAGLIRGETYLTNVIKLRPSGNNIEPYYNSRKGTFTELARPFIEELYEELNEVKPNIIVAAGNIPMAALTKRSKGVSKFRGYIEGPQNTTGFSLPELLTEKVLITLHPSSTFFRGEGATKGGPGKGASPYIGRYYISHDLRKAKKFSGTPALERPKRELIVNLTAREAVEWIVAMADSGRVATDIEVLNYEVSCISLACAPELSISIPLMKYNEYEELAVVRALAEHIFGNTKVVKVLQNSIFDLYFLWMKYGIITLGPVEDTMVAHHIMYLDMARSLEFLASIHGGAQEYWKDLVRFDNIKENA